MVTSVESELPALIFRLSRTTLSAILTSALRSSLISTLKVLEVLLLNSIAKLVAEPEADSNLTSVLAPDSNMKISPSLTRMMPPTMSVGIKYVAICIYSLGIEAQPRAPLLSIVLSVAFSDEAGSFISPTGSPPASIFVGKRLAQPAVCVGRPPRRIIRNFLMSG